jgi:hypothetical protein
LTELPRYFHECVLWIYEIVTAAKLAGHSGMSADSDSSACSIFNSSLSQLYAAGVDSARNVDRADQLHNQAVAAAVD